VNNVDNSGHYPRKRFGKIKTILDIPDLIDVQRKSYERFLQMDVPHQERKEIGLQGAFKTIFPINDLNKTSSLEFVRYLFEKINMTKKNV